MLISAGEHYIELQPETAFELEQLKRIVWQPFKLEVIDPPGATRWPAIELGARLRFNFHAVDR